MDSLDALRRGVCPVVNSQAGYRRRSEGPIELTNQALATRIKRSGEAEESVIDGVLRSTLHNRIHRGPAVWTNCDKCPATAVHKIASGLNDIKARLVTIRQTIKAL